MSQQEIREDVGKVEDILGDVIAEVEAEEAEISPSVEAEPVVEVVETTADFSPCENPKILAKLNGLHNAIMKIVGVTFYKCAGKSTYLNYQVASGKKIKSSLIGMHFSKNGASLTVKTMDGDKPGKDVRVKVTETGLLLNKEPISVKEVLKRTREYRKARGWA